MLWIVACSATPPAESPAPLAPANEPAVAHQAALGEAAAATPSEPASEPAPRPIGCWERELGSAPDPSGLGPSLDGPIAGCDGCETLEVGPNARGLHPEVLKRIHALVAKRPKPEIAEPVVWINSGKRDGEPSESMHNQALGVDVRRHLALARADPARDLGISAPPPARRDHAEHDRADDDQQAGDAGEPEHGERGDAVAADDVAGERHDQRDRRDERRRVERCAPRLVPIQSRTHPRQEAWDGLEEIGRITRHSHDVAHAARPVQSSATGVVRHPPRHMSYNRNRRE
jgi:hypothetical protein